VGPQRAALTDRADDILATSGVHIGGTDFDQRLSLECVMPLLGLRHHGPQGREVPSKVFHDLSTWHLIHWAQTPRAVREANELRSNYADLRLHDRLMRVLRDAQGHRIASEVEQAKIQGSNDDAPVGIDLDFAEAGLSAALKPEDLTGHLDDALSHVVASAHECVRRAGLQTRQLDGIYLTGGSSALRPFRNALGHSFAGVPLVEGDLFGGVAAGLACTAQRLGLA
jgi:hypothetical chaperone protein